MVESRLLLLEESLGCGQLLHDGAQVGLRIGLGIGLGIEMGIEMGIRALEGRGAERGGKGDRGSLCLEGAAAGGGQLGLGLHGVCSNEGGLERGLDVVKLSLVSVEHGLCGLYACGELCMGAPLHGTRVLQPPEHGLGPCVGSRLGVGRGPGLEGRGVALHGRCLVLRLEGKNPACALQHSRSRRSQRSLRGGGRVWLVGLLFFRLCGWELLLLLLLLLELLLGLLLGLLGAGGRGCRGGGGGGGGRRGEGGHGEEAGGGESSRIHV